MIAIIFSLMIDYRVPTNYFYEDKKKVGVTVPMNRRQKRGKGYLKGIKESHSGHQL